MSFFNDLKASLEEAVEIKNGDKKASKVTRFEVADVKAIREQLNVSQSEFAHALGTSIDTVKSWELKRRNPTGLTAKVLIAIYKNPNLFKELARYIISLTFPFTAKFVLFRSKLVFFNIPYLLPFPR